MAIAASMMHWAASPPPLHLGFLLDASGSMESDINDVRTAAIKFLNQNEYAQDVTLVDFDTQVSVVRYRGDDYPRLIERIRMRKAGGMTAFYDALGVYLRGAFEQDGQKILIVYTDGGDTRSAMSFNDLLTSLKAADVTVYAIGFLEHQGSNRNMQRMQLQQIADVTGGQAFFPMSLKEIDKVYDRVIMSYPNVKRLANSLMQLVRRYEQQFGELPAGPGAGGARAAR